jgi:hypothetical protein
MGPMRAQKDGGAEGAVGPAWGDKRGFRMRFSEPVRMADGADHSPVWARTKHRRGNPVISLLVTLLALFGVLTAALGIKEQSLAEGGAMMDGWIGKGVSVVKGEAAKGADEAGEAAKGAAEKTGDAAQAGVTAATEELKKQ